MTQQFNVGDKVQIKPNIQKTEYGWTHRLEQWVRERTILEVRSINSEYIMICETDDFRTLVIEPESLQHLEAELSEGDKVRIKPSYVGRLGSDLAESWWKPQCVDLMFLGFAQNRTKAYVMGPSREVWNGEVALIIPSDAIERVEFEPLHALDVGTIFEYSQTLFMKTNKVSHVTRRGMYHECVVVAKGTIGNVERIPKNELVVSIPEAFFVDYKVEKLVVDDEAVDPWESAKVSYAELLPGDLFRICRGDQRDERCAVVGLEDDMGNNKYIDEHGAIRTFHPANSVYLDSVLVEHDL